MSEDVAEFTAQRGAPPPERLWLVFMGCGETSWCDTPDPNGDGEPSVGYVLAARADRAEAAMRDLLSWFPDKSMPANLEWRLAAGDNGADDAIKEARAALAALEPKP